MQPGSDQIVGGTILRIPAIQSPNFVAGSSGWIIRQDGTVEFSAGIFRGSLQSGTIPGQHVIFNNPATGDPLDVYDSGNNLVTYINSFGVIVAQDPSTGYLARLTQGQFQLNDGHNNDGVIRMIPAASTSQQSELDVLMSPPIGPTYVLRLIGGSDDGSKLQTLAGNERGLQGSLVQADNVSSGNLRHTGTVNGSNTDGSGFLTFAHGAAFTPTGMVMQVHDVGTPAFGMLDYISGSLSAFNATVFAKNFNGTTRTAAPITFDYEVWR